MASDVTGAARDQQSHQRPSWGFRTVPTEVGRQLSALGEDDIVHLEAIYSRP